MNFNEFHVQIIKRNIIRDAGVLYSKKGMFMMHLRGCSTIHNDKVVNTPTHRQSLSVHTDKLCLHVVLWEDNRDEPQSGCLQNGSPKYTHVVFKRLCSVIESLAFKALC